MKALMVVILLAVGCVPPTIERRAHCRGATQELIQPFCDSTAVCDEASPVTCIAVCRDDRAAAFVHCYSDGRVKFRGFSFGIDREMRL